MAVYQSPVGLAAAPVNNQLSEMVTFKESLCEPFCIANSNQPTASVSYEVGETTLNGTTVFVEIIASIQIVVPKKCCGSVIDPHTERFTVAFQGRTQLPTTTPTIESVGRKQDLACVKNGVAKSYVINDSIVVSIGAPSSAS